MQINKLLAKKRNIKKQTTTEIIFSLLHDAGVELNDKEKQTFTFYLEKCEKGEKEKEAFEVVNTILKDRNEKTTNVKGRIISELKKIEIKKKKIVSDNKSCTNIRIRHGGFFSVSNTRRVGVYNNDNMLVTRIIETSGGKITQFNGDLIYFDEKVLYALCTIAKETQSQKVEFTLREMCRILQLTEDGKSMKRIIKSIRNLKSVFFEIDNFLLEDDKKNIKSFSFIHDYNLVDVEDKSRNAKSYVYLSDLIYKQAIDIKYIKKMDKKYFKLKGYEFKIYNYVNIVNKKVVILNIETILSKLAIEKSVLDDSKKLRIVMIQISRALRNLKTKEYIKDFKIEGRGKNKKYTFKL